LLLGTGVLGGGKTQRRKTTWGGESFFCALRKRCFDGGVGLAGGAYEMAGGWKD